MNLALEVHLPIPSRIAIMLGRLEKDVPEFIDAYVSLSKRVFVRKGLPLNFKGGIKGRFDSSELEKCIKEIITGKGHLQNALLNNGHDRDCRM